MAFPPDIDSPSPLLGGLSPAQFMRRHWQKKPLLVRQAWPGVQPPVTRAGMQQLAASDEVESRVVSSFEGRWQLKRGPFGARSLPAWRKPGWTLLVSGLDLHVQAAHEMLQPFRFVPEARLDDLMISWASDGGGVGPHLDSYDVFLLQVHGRRRWRIGRAPDKRMVPGLPVKILQHFEPEEEFVLEPGDMLYLPPLWGHDGIAEGECMTCSVGFRAAYESELARELLQRLAEDHEGEGGTDERSRERLYRDASQGATSTPAAMPESLTRFAQGALDRVLREPQALARALGEVMTEPKPQVWFNEGGALAPAARGVRLDRRTRMMYDAQHVFINGEAFRAGGRDARAMRALADTRELSGRAWQGLSAQARALVDEWCEAGWCHDIDA
jgi:50S ribosomal protein L16 3-hydroxylase